MILLDTHIWVWWVSGSARLSAAQVSLLQGAVSAGLGVSVVSCWELAKLVQLGRVKLTLPLEQWMQSAVSAPGVRLLGLTPKIAIESTRLPAPIHRDPADQLIVATARIHDLPLMTDDARIIQYGQLGHVKLAI